MTDKNILDDAFPQHNKLEDHYKKFPIQPYEFISKNDLSFFSRQCCKIRLQISKKKWRRRYKKDNTLLSKK